MSELNIEYIYSIKNICDFFNDNKDLINNNQIKIIEIKYEYFDVGNAMIIKYSKEKS